MNTTLSVLALPKTIFPSAPPAKVTIPTKNELPVTDKAPPTFTSEANVDTPDTSTLSRSVCPSTSKSPLRSVPPDTVTELRVPSEVMFG